MAATKDFIIEQGKTFAQTLRWETPPILYKPITGILATAPARIQCPGHNIPPGWRVAVVSVKGMTQINAPNTPPKDKDFHQATVVDADNIELNDVNAASYKAYQSGGFVQLFSPVDLTGYTARMSIKDKVGGTTFLSLTSENGRIFIDAANHTIGLAISAADTAALTQKKGVYDLEMVGASGFVTKLLSGSISIVREVTT